MAPAILLLLASLSGAPADPPGAGAPPPAGASASSIHIHLNNRTVGAWGAGSFDNDDALDWVADLADGGGMDVIHSAFEMVADGEYLEAPEASAAVAAAEIVAALAGRPLADDEMPEEAAEWIAANARHPGERLVRRAHAVVQRVRTESELKDLWESDEDALAGWYAEMDDLLARLGAGAAGD